jgi:hypothetical protein
MALAAATEYGEEKEANPEPHGSNAMPHAKVDPELLRQLEHAAASDAPVGAVFCLRPAPSQKFIPPDEAEPLVRRILQRVEHEVGSAPEQLNVLKNLGSFVVSAGAPFVKKLLDQAEIASATANQQSEDPRIRPVESKRVRNPGQGRRKGN